MSYHRRRKGGKKAWWSRKVNPYQGRTCYGKYKRLQPATGVFRCKILDRPCITQTRSPCGDCPVICKRKRLKPGKKCETCNSKFLCWTGEFDPVRKEKE